ncbi:MAG: hypothetical protein FJ306_02420 [Planctomycetes bacterium]|nr:hypothetical protein [Planctomycetota bacterium]
MRTVEEQLSPCGVWRVVRFQEIGPAVFVQHAVIARAADGAVLLDLTDPGCTIDSCFFDAAKPGWLHVVMSRASASLLSAHFVIDLAAGKWEVHDGGRAEPWRGDFADLMAISRGRPLEPSPDPSPPSPEPARLSPSPSGSVDLDALMCFLPSVGTPINTVRTFGELELAPRRRYRVVAPIPDSACRHLAIGDIVTYLRYGLFARENGYTLQFAGGPRQWFELRLSDDDPREGELLWSLHRYLAPL